MMPTCPTCSNPLFLDTRTMLDLLALGRHGGRVYCSSGHDYWLLGERDALMAPAMNRRSDGRGKYERRVRMFTCEVCRREHSTRGPKTRWCIPCKIQLQREKDRARHQRRKQAQARGA
jgi:hypothetical protein